MNIPRVLLRSSILLVLAVVPFAMDAESAPPQVTRTLDDYRHFRTVAIDLEGRVPTRDEIAATERPDWNLDRWIDQHVSGPGYVERLTRVYMDLLRLEPNLIFTDPPAQLMRATITGPDGKPVYVYYRNGQRRLREATDGDFCLDPDETGLVMRPNAEPIGTAKKVSKKTLDQYTVVVRPWWLYHDYKAWMPSQRYGEGWANPDPEYRPVEALLTEPDGKPTTEVRVCREEAQTTQDGHVYASGRKPPGTAGPAPKPGIPAAAAKPGAPAAAPKPGALAVHPQAPPPPPASVPNAKPAAPGGPTTMMGAPMAAPTVRYTGGRVRPAPVDNKYAIDHKGEPVSCATRMGLDYGVDCGCGVGLERCEPSTTFNMDSPAFYYPSHMPLGPGLPLDEVRQSASRWFPYWWSREAVRMLGYIFQEDRDFREILTGHETFVNGPLSQFYRVIQRGNCCGPEATFGMKEESEPLFDPAKVPADLEPQDVGTWKFVPDRGPHASGLLTTPMFLEKYASARARGAVLYNVFLCKSFLADKAQLTPSDEPNLTVRPGCSTCHATLEPLAAYFARVEPASFVFLPEALFPAKNPACKKDKNGHLNGPCNALYDVAFSDAHEATLKSSYASVTHADEEPAGAGRDITAMPEFASCAVQQVTTSFLGRPVNADDQPLLHQLTDDFVKSGYRMRTVVKGIVRSNTYRQSNNLSSTTWRGVTK
jgi:hypothetical protein